MPKLTALKVKHAGPGVHGDGEGLYLRVKPSGAKSWVLRVQFDKKREDIGLGGVCDLTLDEAREKARLLRKMARQGKSARAERDRERRRIPTFAEAVNEAHTELAKGWTTRTGKAFKSTLLQHAVPKIGTMTVDAVGAADMILVLAPIWTEKPAMARVVRHYMLKVLAFAKAKAWRTDGLPDARELRGGLSRPVRGGNFEAMPYSDVPDFFAGELESSSNSGRWAMLFAILTAARSAEVRQAKWEQVDLEARTWSRPAEVMKSRVAHVITLSTAAIALLEKLFPEKRLRKGPLFPGARGKQLSDVVLTKAMRRTGRTETVHGFRSTFRDWAAEQMPTVPAMVAEMALAHKVGSATEQAYLRTDLREMRFALLEAWGRYVSPSLAGVPCNVTPITRAVAQ